MNNVLERLPGALTQQVLAGPETAAQAPPAGEETFAGAPQSDRISQFMPPVLPPGGPGNPGIIQQLIALLEQLLSSLGMGGSGGAPGPQPQNYFQNASGSSLGDPHLTFDGTEGDGQTLQSQFDSMTSHPDLLNSGSFAGGYRISTQSTAPDANGVTYNREASVLTNFGGTQVSLDNAGNAFVEQNGQQFALSDGQSYNLGNGETVSRAADGSVSIADQNGRGGTITTTLSENGHGVDVRVQAQDVELGGYLVQQQPPAPVTQTGPAVRVWPQTETPQNWSAAEQLL